MARGCVHEVGLVGQLPNCHCMVVRVVRVVLWCACHFGMQHSVAWILGGRDDVHDDCLID